MKNCFAQNIDNWIGIGASNVVLDWIQTGVNFPLYDDIKSFEIPNKTFTKSESAFIRSELQSLLLLGHIEICESRPFCVSPINCVPKKRGDFRLITDLRYINRCCVPPKFKNEDINTVIDIVKPKDYMCTADLKNGFFHIPVSSELQDLLGFSFEHIYYKWTVLPFGHCCSPYFFTNTLRPVITYLRSKGIRVVVYVDDFIVLSAKHDISSHTEFLLNTLAGLGWTVNLEKSLLEPSQVKPFIGYIIDNTGDQTVIRIEKDRIRKLKKDISRALRYNVITARGLARIAGQCISMCKCVFPAKLLLRNLYRQLAQKEGWDQKISLDPYTRNDLEWFFNSVSQWNALYVVNKNIDVHLVTDASQCGWGAWIPGKEAQGFWNERMSMKSSNYRELFAVLMGILSFKGQLKNQKVQILSDNVTTVAMINGMGGSSVQLDIVARTIHIEALEANITLSAKYLAGTLNWRADHLSRVRSTYEWRLHPNLFKMLDRVWGPHHIDRSASITSTQLPVYNSLYWDPQTSGVDALAQTNRGTMNNFVNAPFALIPKILNIIREQKAVATLIAPKWVGQPWFQQLMDLLIEQPIKLPFSERSIIALGPQKEPFKNRTWNIYAWRISGRQDCGAVVGQEEPQDKLFTQ